MAEPGKVYLVGAGPGDPGLLTLKGQRCLAEADLVLYDGLVNSLILRHSRAEAERTCRVDTGRGKRLDQSAINDQLIEAARAGKTVVRLKGGDPFIFGRGSEEAAALAEAGIPFEVIPGITAATAAAEYAGISLTHRDLASAVAFITGHENPGKPAQALDYEQLSRFSGTLVFYMGLHRLPQIAAALVEHGRSSTTPVAVISRGTTPQQRTITGTLDDIAEKVRNAALHAPSLIIVGECVLQRDRINWFESLPLFGVSIGITRPPGQADEVIDLVLSRGGEPVLMPTMAIRPIRDWSEVDAKLDQIGEFDWIVFTSVNAVDAVFGRLWKRGGDARQLGSGRIACIGPATAERLERFGVRADLVPEVYRGEALADSLAPHVKGKRVLWPRANRGRDVLPEGLTTAGAIYEEVIVYEHQDLDAAPVSVLERIDGSALDWVALGSPAVARQVADWLAGRDVANTRFAAISPVTEQAALEAGLNVDAVATEHTWAGLIRAIEETVTQGRSR